MHTKNKILVLVIIAIALMVQSLNLDAQARRKAKIDMKAFRYELECVGVGVEGTYLVKIWSYSKRPKIAIEQAKKNAVHGVIFKGFGGEIGGCPSQKPLAASLDVQDEYADFFEKFFEDKGGFNKYVTVSNDGVIDPEDRLKVNREYKIGMVVSVLKDKLRADLEKEGIIKSLSSGF